MHGIFIRGVPIVKQYKTSNRGYENSLNFYIPLRANLRSAPAPQPRPDSFAKRMCSTIFMVDYQNGVAKVTLNCPLGAHDYVANEDLYILREP